VTGIQNLVQAPFPSAEFTVVNQYLDPYSQGWVQVFAGAAMATNSDGTLTEIGPGIRVYEGPDNTNLTYAGQFLISGETGKAEIVSATSSSLTIEVAGKTYDFDLAGNTFSTSTS
jgi:hypothetical protein